MGERREHLAARLKCSPDLSVKICSCRPSGNTWPRSAGGGTRPVGNSCVPLLSNARRKAPRILCLSSPPDPIRRARSTKFFPLLFGVFRWSFPQERVGMNLFSERLFTSDHPDPRRFDTCKSEPIPAGDCVLRIHDHITNAGVEMESGKDPLVHSRFDGVTCPALRRGGQIHDRRSDHILKPITKMNMNRGLQHLP